MSVLSRCRAHEMRRKREDTPLLLALKPKNVTDLEELARRVSNSVLKLSIASLSDRNRERIVVREVLKLCKKSTSKNRRHRKF